MTSIKIVNHRRSVSKLHEDFGNVLTDAVDSNAARMPYVSQRTIDRRVYAVINTSEIQVTLKLAVRDECQLTQKAVNRTATVRKDTFARSMLPVKGHALIRVKMLLVAPMNIVNWTRTAIQYANAKKVSFGILCRLDVKNHRFLTVLPTPIAQRMQHVDQMYLEYSNVSPFVRNSSVLPIRFVWQDSIKVTANVCQVLLEMQRTETVVDWNGKINV